MNEILARQWQDLIDSTLAAHPGLGLPILREAVNLWYQLDAGSWTADPDRLRELLHEHDLQRSELNRFLALAEQAGPEERPVLLALVEPAAWPFFLAA